MKLWPQPPNQPVKIEPAQCPNCGAYGEHTGSLWRDLSTGATFQQTAVLGAETTGVIAIASLIAAVACVTWLFGPDSLWLALILGGILALSVISLATARRVSREAHAILILRYKCVRCLHEWDHQEGKPPPRHNEAQEVLADYRAVFGDAKGQDDAGV
jgi:hypothetical protein